MQYKMTTQLVDVDIAGEFGDKSVEEANRFLKSLQRNNLTVWSTSPFLADNLPMQTYSSPVDIFAVAGKFKLKDGIDKSEIEKTVLNYN